MDMKVSVNVGLFLVNLIGKGLARLSKYENVKKGESIIYVDFHSELDMGRDVV